MSFKNALACNPRIAIGTVITLSLWVVNVLHAASPDTILYGGRIVQTDPNDTIAEAVAIENSRISAIGAADTVKKLKALRAYTINAAFASFEEEQRSLLGVGKQADLAVLDRDYFAVPINEVDSLKSALTLVGSKAVFDGGPFAPLNQN